MSIEALMKKALNFPQLPSAIHVDVSKGTSGVLLAKLTQYNIFTEADSLNDLFLQVNDLIYTYFDVPKKYQGQITYIPPKTIQYELVKIASQTTTKSYTQFTVKPQYDLKLAELIAHRSQI